MTEILHHSAAAFTLTLQEAFMFSGGTATIGADGVSILSGGNLGLEYYPLWNESYRGTLNGKIYDHYLLREIGFETIEIFQQRMRSHMNVIMPYFNDLYKTQLDLVDPLRTVDLSVIVGTTSTQDVTANSASDSEVSNKAGSRVINSDFPQNMLSGDSDYASSGADTNTTSSMGTVAKEDNVSNSVTDTDVDSKTTGYQGAPGDIITAYRAAILNIDAMIIRELEPMFMQIFNNGDSYTYQNGIFG